MDLLSVAREHEAEQRRLQAQRDAEDEVKRQHREANASMVQSHLSTVVEPVFQTAKQQITEMGHPCRVEVAQIEDNAMRDTGKSEKRFALRMVLYTDREKRTTNSDTRASLEYEGNFSNEMVYGRIRLPDASGPHALGNLPVGELTKEMIEGHVKRFFKAVLDRRVT